MIQKMVEKLRLENDQTKQFAFRKWKLDLLYDMFDKDLNQTTLVQLRDECLKTAAF
jgi:hypothetical protein